jgi:kynurenine formamidase
LKRGIVTRGILVDFARLKGVPYLEPGTPIYSEDIEAWEQRAKVKVSPGDAIFVRTGRWARRSALGPWQVATSSAGFHASVLPWIKTRGVAIVGSDAATDVMPSRVEGVTQPVHTMLLAGFGTNIFDNMDLEALAEAAATENRWEFMLRTARPCSSGDVRWVWPSRRTARSSCPTTAATGPGGLPLRPLRGERRRTYREWT